MKYFRKSFLACTVVVVAGTTLTYAQMEYDEIRPSVNAQQFISATSGENNLHTGQLSVNIPLFTLQSKGIDVPISISFNAGGITHESEASNIGLGWSLLAGGVIAHTIRDKNDLQTSTSNHIPWQYQSNYLQNKWYEETNSPYSNNLFDMAMTSAIGFDGEPDIFKYAFLGYSGDIRFRHDVNGNISGKLYPHKSFMIENTVLGYKITANDGNEYYFETKEHQSVDDTGWFLTEIKTQQGGSVRFDYADEQSLDLTRPTGSPGSYASRMSKRLRRIDYDRGYVIFNALIREDMPFSLYNPNSLRITSIEHYDHQGQLVKGFELNNNSYILNEYQSGSEYNKRLKLNSIREYSNSGEYLPPYKFEYDYHFYLSKNSSIGDPFGNSAKNSWALNPGSLASVYRNFGGFLDPWVEWDCYHTPSGEQCIPKPVGHETSNDPIDGFTFTDFLCLTKIEFPAGGSESYFYEPHDYAFVSTYSDPPPSLYMQKWVKGKRLWKKEIADGNGNKQTVLYKYCLHDQDYQQVDDGNFSSPKLISSGILVNPTIHTSTVYKPVFSHERAGLGASPHYTPKPQNSLSGSAVYYSEVEEIFVSEPEGQNGKKIYFFEKMYSFPANNFVYLNYNRDGNYFIKGNRLTGLPNTLFGKQQYPPNEPELSGLSNQNYTYLAYPVGRFNIPHLRAGKLLKEVDIDANGNVLKKVENEYTAGYGIEETLYGLVVKKFDDNDYTVNPYPPFDVNRYLISQTMLQFGVIQLINKKTTNYYQNGAVIEAEHYAYSPLNLLKSITKTLSNGENQITEHVYPGDIVFQTTSNLSGHALAIHRMKDKNMTGVPVQRTVRKGPEYIGGSYTSFKQAPGGNVVVDTVFNLSPQAGATMFAPIVNSSGKIERDNKFISDKVYLSYDENLNPTTLVGKDGVIESIVWGHGGRYPVARIVNYTNAQLQSNGTLINLLGQLDNYTVITEPERVSLLSLNEAIRHQLPGNTKITTYTYDPLKGVTSQTDFNGLASFYKYDSFNRLQRVYDHEGNILKEYYYNYKN